MSLGVIVHRRAQQDLDEYLAWLSKHAPVTTAAWFARLEGHILALAETGPACLRAAESRRTSLDLRESYFGKRPNVFRILIYLEGQTVHVIRVRRAQRRLLTGKEIHEAIGRGSEDPSE